MSTEHEAYVIKSGARPAGDPSKYDFEVIQSALDATDPGKVSAAGYSYNTASRIMAQVAHQLYLVGNALAGKWKGADATAAQKALGQLYTTANELYWRSQQAGAALQTYGAALDQYKGLKWPAGGASPAEDPARQQAAQKVMESLNQHMGNAWDTMPDKVQSNLPGLDRSVGESSYPSGPTSSGARSGSSGPVGAGGGHASSGHIPLPHGPHVTGGSSAGGQNTHLAGAPPAGGPAVAPPSSGNTFSPGAPSGTPSPVGDAFTPGGMPPSFSGGRFSRGSLSGDEAGLRRIAAEEVLSPESTGSAPGSAAAAEEVLPPRSAGGAPLAAAAEEDAALRERSGLMGPGGATGAGAASSTERERRTWLTEDRDIWTGGEEATPRVLGASAAPRDTGQDSERERTAWLDEEREVWTGPETAVGGTVGDGPARSAAVEESGDAAPEILDISQLQDLLDAVAPDNAATGGRTKTPTESAKFFGGGDNAEVNEIDRLLNG